MRKLHFVIILLITVVNLNAQTKSGLTKQQQNISGSDFAIIGDNPYTSDTVEKYKTMLKTISEDKGISWVLNVGDFQGGNENCDDLAKKIKRLHTKAIISKDIIITPGDNDIDACDKEEPKWRKAIYEDNEITLPSNIKYQEGHIENKIWKMNNVLFATVNVYPPTNEETKKSAKKWLKLVFKKASGKDIRGIMISTHTDIYQFYSGNALWKATQSNSGVQLEYVTNGYGWVSDTLRDLTIKLKKAVVLVVGHTHIFRIDKAMQYNGKQIPNFTRVQPPGNPYVHWVRGSIKEKPAEKINNDFDEVFIFNQEWVTSNIVWPEPDPTYNSNE